MRNEHIISAGKTLKICWSKLERVQIRRGQTTIRQKK